MRFVDTAGMRRQVKVRGVEYFSFVRATEAIERAHVVVLVIDASEGFTVEDKKIVNRVMDEGRAFTLVANKWDLVEEKDRTYKILEETLQPFAHATVMRTSAVTGQGVHRLPPVLLDLHARWTTRAPTSRVNEVIQQAQRERPTPRLTGNLHYATQTGTGPPAFVIFGGREGARRRLRQVHREPAAPGVPPGGRADPSQLQAPAAARSRWQLVRYGLVRRGRPARRCPPGTISRHGPWRSLVSASDWGSEGRGFESRRPDR